MLSLNSSSTIITFTDYKSSYSDVVSSTVLLHIVGCTDGSTYLRSDSFKFLLHFLNMTAFTTISNLRYPLYNGLPWVYQKSHSLPPRGLPTSVWWQLNVFPQTLVDQKTRKTFWWTPVSKPGLPSHMQCTIASKSSPHTPTALSVVLSDLFGIIPISYSIYRKTARSLSTFV